MGAPTRQYGPSDPGTAPAGVAGKLRPTALLRAVGHTPLVELEVDAEAAERGVRLFAKLETCNPGGSLKDRPVARMLLDGLRAGALAGGRRLLDSSSGNAGIAYAMFGAALGVPVTLVVPGNASRERLARIAAHGAELILTDPLEGYDFAVREAQRLARAHPERYWHCNQYANRQNWLAHYEGTAPEILAQLHAGTGGVPDCLVAGVGTGGSLTGMARRLRAANPALHVVAIVPDVFPGIEGLKPLGHAGDLVPEIYDETLVDERLAVTSAEALAASRALALQGYFVGASSGAYVHAARLLAAQGRWRCIVTLLCDTGERYGSTGMWGEASGA